MLERERFTVIGTGNTAMKKTALVSPFMALTFWRGGVQFRGRGQKNNNKEIKGNKFLEYHIETREAVTLVWCLKISPLL